MSRLFKVELGDGKKLETFSVHSACDMIDTKELILNPEYQTGSRWKGVQQAKLIDSVVNGLDLRSFGAGQLLGGHSPNIGLLGHFTRLVP